MSYHSASSPCAAAFSGEISNSNSSRIGMPSLPSRGISGLMLRAASIAPSGDLFIADRGETGQFSRPIERTVSHHDLGAPVFDRKLAHPGPVGLGQSMHRERHLCLFGPANYP